MMRLALIAALLLMTPGLAAAQDAGAPAMGSSATAGDDAPVADAEEQVIRVLALGDTVGGGLGAGLMRVGELDGRYEVAIRYNEESGLARPEVYDWASSLPKILESNDFDVIVALIGVNDRQMIRDGNMRYAFGTPEWTAAYTTQMDRVLSILKKSGARVFWVSIPPMRDPEFDAAMRQISDLQKARVEAAGATYIDIRPQLLDKDGRYVESGPDETGAITRLRGKDGISFFKHGNNRLGQLVLQAIQRREVAPAAKVAVQPEPEQAPVARVQQRQPRAVPVFGQTLFSGEVMLLRPDNVTVGSAMILAAGATARTPAESMEMLRAMAQPGTSAEALFSSGIGTRTPSGRTDDFRVAPEAAN